MTENLSHNLEDLFQEIVETGRGSGVVDEEAFRELVGEVIENHRGLGEIHDDESTEGMIELLKDRWIDYREMLGLDDKNPQI